ncbi:hypothetical protein DFH09DRAFT_1354717 [Mycena vulgaris]|nr:hypothetical protein DFH09DRAFT_1354717 [Mycena vulgaris]
MSFNDAPLSSTERELLDSLSGRDLMDFRNFIYSPTYIRANAAMFLDNEWIKVSELRDFLSRRDQPVLVSFPPLHVPPTRVKQETVDSRFAATPIKLETEAGVALVRTRTLQDGGREVVEILSDSEDGSGTGIGENIDLDSDFEVAETLFHSASRSSSIPAGFLHTSDIDTSDSDDESGLRSSDTIWQDPGLTSRVLVGRFRVTTAVTVDRVEYLSKIPSIWPIPRIPTAFVLSLDSSYGQVDPKTGLLYTVDHLIKNHDNDSWKATGTGAADNKPMVMFAPGLPLTAIECRRARMKCKGCCACERVDPKLIKVDRYELDPTSRDAVFTARQNTRRTEGTTAFTRTAGFYNVVVNQKCRAIDAAGMGCDGNPTLRPKKDGPSRGQQYWIACDGWRRDFKQNHRTFVIPDYADEKILLKLFAKQPISDDNTSDTPLCSCIVHPTTGLKQKNCPYPHIVDGLSVTHSRIKRYPCTATRTIYVPVDPSIRKALVVHKERTPHSHPMPALTKASLDVKEVYRACVDAAGSVGATVNKVDYSHSTKLLLSGNTPALFDPSLQNKHVKREIVHDVKTKNYPAGLGIPGAFQLYFDDLKKPEGERYIHCCRMTDDTGGILIITGVPFLIKLLDDPGVSAFEDDTTFKRIRGEMNEWELALYFKAIQRAVTSVRAYINRASTDFFEILFDELQKIKKRITKKVLGLKRFVPGGNLLVMNADMEAAQILGAARSVMKTNDPEYSGIPSDTPPAEAATYFVKVCYRHTKEAIHDFKAMVTPEQYARLMDFMYIDSKERLDEFSKFVKSLGVKKIQDWWAHKEMSDWIIPCLVKSQSRILPEDWDNTPATTNTGETQHHWTNSLTGINLTLVEAIESARAVDENAAREIEASLKTGILANAQNELYHRTARNLQRQSKAAQKVRDSNELADILQGLTLDLADLQERRRQLGVEEKNLREQIKTAKGPSGRGKKSAPRGSRSILVSASSTGRVKTATVSAPDLPAVSPQSTALPNEVVSVLDSPPTSPVFSSLYAVGSTSAVTPTASPVFQSLSLPSSALLDAVWSTPAVIAPCSEPSMGEFAQWAGFDYDFETTMTSAANAGVMSDTRGLLLQPGYAPYVPSSFVPNYGTPTQAFAYGENNAASFTQHHDVHATGWGPATMDELLDSSFLSGSGGEEPFYSPYSQPFAHTVPYSDQLPPLPAPPSPSEFSSPPQIPTSVNPRKRRPEVDEANIIHCSRARTKSAKLKLASEPGASSSSKPKRAKATKRRMQHRFPPSPASLPYPGAPVCSPHVGCVAAIARVTLSALRCVPSLPGANAAFAPACSRAHLIALRMRHPLSSAPIGSVATFTPPSSPRSSLAHRRLASHTSLFFSPSASSRHRVGPEQLV